MRLSRIASALMLAGLCMPIVTRAQVAPRSTPSLLPHLTVEDFSVTIHADRTVQGTFTAANFDATPIENLRAELLVLGTTPSKLGPANRYPLYDSTIVSENISLAGAAKRRVNLTHQLLPVPEGSYRLQLQLRLPNNQAVASTSLPVHLGGATAFAVMEPGIIQVKSTDPRTNQDRDIWAASEGVLVDGGQNMKINVSIHNPGTDALAGSFAITTKRLGSVEDGTVSQGGPEVALPAGSAPRTIALPLSAQSKPGTYAVRLAMHDSREERVSGIAEYTYRVRGEIKPSAVREHEPTSEQTPSAAFSLLFIYLLAVVVLGVLVTVLIVWTIAKSRAAKNSPSSPDVIH